MINIFISCKKFITLVKQEGIRAAIRAVYDFLISRDFQIKYRFLVLYYNIFHRGLALKKIQGNNMYLIAKDSGISKDLMFKGIREPLQTDLVKQLIKPGMTVVDIGANLGYYTLIEASLVGSEGRVYAIEPIPRNYEILVKNIRKNKYEDIVETHLLAMSDRSGISEIAMTNQSNWPTMFLNEDEISDTMKRNIKINAKKIIEVKTATLDEFLINRRPADFIRMDVEGYEGRIIKGISNTVKNSKNSLKLFMEIHPIHFKEPIAMVTEIIQDMSALGLTVKFIVDSWSNNLLEFSQDNLLEIICSETSPCIFLEKN